MNRRSDVESVPRREVARKVRAVDEEGGMRWDASTRPSRVDVEEAGRLEYFWWDAVDRDGMERVSDWFVCVWLLLWASRS